MTRGIVLTCSFVLFAALALAHAFADKQPPKKQEEITLSFAPVVKKAAPAVVNIYTKRKQRKTPFMDDPIFRYFFGQSPFEEPDPDPFRSKLEHSLGSGVIVRPDGLIVTNTHVVEGSDEIIVVLSNDQEYDAKIVLSDEKTDLTILAVSNTEEPLPYLELHDSDQLEVGDLVLAIGNPFGVGQAVSSGIISGLARTSVSASDFQFYIQTDAAINPGNSGGALITMDGKLAGINTAIFSKSGGSNGVGFATPSKIVSSLLRSLKSGLVFDGQIIRPWLGVSVQDVTKDIAQTIGQKIPAGVIIKSVYPKSAADKAGLKVGDVITHIDGFIIADEQSMDYRIATYIIGRKIDVTVIRNHRPMTRSISMIAPPEEPKRDTRTYTGNHPLSGTKGVNISPATLEEFSLSDIPAPGVIISEVDPHDIGARLGIQEGDIIESINEVSITSTKQLEKVLKNSGNSWFLVIKRGEKHLRFAIS